MEHEVRDTQSQGVSRRGFLTGIGAGAAGAAGAVVLPSEAVAEQETGCATRPDRFTRMFELRPFAEPRRECSRRCGTWARRADPRRRGPASRRAHPPHHEPGAQSRKPGQSIVDCRRDLLRPVPRSRHDVRHDIAGSAFRRGPSARRTRGRRRSISTRCTAADRTASPQLYEPSDRAKFRVEHGGAVRRSAA